MFPYIFFHVYIFIIILCTWEKAVAKCTSSSISQKLNVTLFELIEEYITSTPSYKHVAGLVLHHCKNWYAFLKKKTHIRLCMFYHRSVCSSWSAIRLICLCNSVG